MSRLLTTFPPFWRMLVDNQFWESSLEALFSVFWTYGSRSGPWELEVQSMVTEFVGCWVRVGTEWIDAVWKELLDSWESDESITISCPKVEQLGLMLSGVCCSGSSEVSMRSMIVVSLGVVWCNDLSVVGWMWDLKWPSRHLTFSR